MTMKNTNQQTQGKRKKHHLISNTLICTIVFVFFMVMSSFSVFGTYELVNIKNNLFSPYYDETSNIIQFFSLNNVSYAIYPRTSNSPAYRGYQWNGSKWIENSSIIVGLPNTAYGGSYGFQIFSLNSSVFPDYKIHMIGDRLNSIICYSLNESIFTWELNSALCSGLSPTSSNNRAHSIFTYTNDTYNFIGTSISNNNAQLFKWNTATNQWNLDTSNPLFTTRIVTTNSYLLNFNEFHYKNTLYAIISGRYGGCNGQVYNTSSSSWQNFPQICHEIQDIMDGTNIYSYAHFFTHEDNISFNIYIPYLASINYYSYIIPSISIIYPQNQSNYYESIQGISSITLNNPFFNSSNMNISIDGDTSRVSELLPFLFLLNYSDKNSTLTLSATFTDDFINTGMTSIDLLYTPLESPPTPINETPSVSFLSPFMFDIFEQNETILFSWEGTDETNDSLLYSFWINDEQIYSYMTNTSYEINGTNLTGYQVAYVEVTDGNSSSFDYVVYFINSSETQLIPSGNFSFNFDWSSDSRLQYGQCPSSPQALMNFWGIMFVLLLVGLYSATMKNAGLSYVAGFGFIFLTLIAWSCSSIIGAISIILGIGFLFVGNGLRETN